MFSIISIILIAVQVNGEYINKYKKRESILGNGKGFSYNPDENLNVVSTL